MTNQTVTKEELDVVVKNLNNNIISTADNLQNNQNLLQEQIIALDSKIINPNNDIYEQFENLINIHTVGKYTYHSEIKYKNNSKIIVKGEKNIIFDSKNNTIILNITYNEHENHPVEKIEKIKRELKYYIKDNKILYESTTYNNNNTTVASRIGYVLNVTKNSFQIIYNGSRTSNAGIVENILVTVTKEETSGILKSSTNDDKFVVNTNIVPIK